MKLHIISLAAVAAFAGSAHAAKPTAAQAAAAAFELNIHGSSAFRKLVERLVAKNCDVPADLAIWRSARQPWFGSSTESFDGDSANIYSCVMNYRNDFGSTYDNQLVTINFRVAGDSTQGVFPVGKPASVPAANLRSMNIATCDYFADTQDGSDGPDGLYGPYGLCTGEKTQAPDMGLSEQEPAVYNSVINRDLAFRGLTVVDADFESPPIPFVQLVTGVVVNDKLYTDLQADQGTTGVPSVSSVGFANLWSIGYNPALGWSPLCKDPYNCSALTLANTNINLAVRAIGSGTRAAAGLFFNNTPFGKVTKQWATGSSLNTFSAAVTGGRSVFNASRDRWVVAALDTCGDATAASPRYCIGILGLDTDLIGTRVKFVNVDNSALAGAKLGQYRIVYEGTYQISRNASAASKELAFRFGAAAGMPWNIYEASNGRGTMLALPGSCHTFPYAEKEAVVCSRVSRGGYSTNNLMIVK
jgi:hypothetical protein